MSALSVAGNVELGRRAGGRWRTWSEARVGDRERPATGQPIEPERPLITLPSRLDSFAVTSKKHRGRQLARASANRQAIRRAEREARRRRNRWVTAVVVAVVLVGALAAWVVTHPPSTGSAGAEAVVDYDAASVLHPTT